MTGKRPDPGGYDFADFYYRGVLVNDGNRSSNSTARDFTSHRGLFGQQRYYRANAHIPLRYDDYRDYMKFRYELGEYP